MVAALPEEDGEIKRLKKQARKQRSKLAKQKEELVKQKKLIESLIQRIDILEEAHK